jgi:hypothetical protein
VLRGGTLQAMWGIIGKIKMFDRLAKSVGGGPHFRLPGLFVRRSDHYGYRDVRV